MDFDWNKREVKYKLQNEKHMKKKMKIKKLKWGK